LHNRRFLFPFLFLHLNILQTTSYTTNFIPIMPIRTIANCNSFSIRKESQRVRNFDFAWMPFSLSFFFGFWLRVSTQVR
jgi:hypothetical protein